MTLEELAADAARGDSSALRTLVERIAPEVHRLTTRFLGHPADAADAAQEILTLVFTRLSTFEGRSTLRTWWTRIAVRYLLRERRKRSALEDRYPSLEELAERLGQPPSPIDAALTDAVDTEVWKREVFTGCTRAMLVALPREQRIAFVLGDLLGLPGETGARAAGVAPATFRQQQTRARKRLVSFMQGHCGVFDTSNACRCEFQVGALHKAGVIAEDRLAFGKKGAHPDEVQSAIDGLGELRRAIEILRAHEDEVPTTLEPVLRALREGRSPLH